MNIDVEGVQQLLHREHARVELELTDIGYLHNNTGLSSVGAPKDIGAEPADMNGMGDFDGVQENNKALAVDLVARKDEIEHALARLEEGTYGTCEKCSRPIEERRLAANPAASTCMRCA
jgi:DnaK suppressor protein